MKEPNTGQGCGRLITVGYEGKKIPEFCTALILSGVSILFDVGKNAISRKPGFSKAALSEFCHKFNIEYHHLPEFGIDSALRKNLHGEEDLRKLFLNYEKTVLLKTKIPGIFSRF